MSSEQRSGEVPERASAGSGGPAPSDRAPSAWWLGLLWAAILVGAGYWGYRALADLAPGPDSPSAGAGPSAAAREAARAEEQAAAARPVTNELLVALGKDPAVVAKGRAVYVQQCVSCHGIQGQGSIGPNLTDSHWLNGGTPMDIHRAVAAGVVARGMPAWGSTLGPLRVQQLVAYLLTLKGTQVPGGKRAEGVQAP